MMQYVKKKSQKRKFKIPSYPNWGYQKDNLLTQYIETHINPDKEKKVKKKPRSKWNQMFLPG